MPDLLPSDARTVITKIARRLSPQSGTVDSLANDRDDYVSELTGVFFRAKDKFQIRCPDAAEDEPGAYAYKSLWNHAAEVQRMRSRRLGTSLWEYDPDTEAHPLDLEEQAQQREALGLVQRCVSPRQWELLRAYAEAGGSVAETHRGYDWGVGVGYLRQQVRDVQKKAQKVLVEAGFCMNNLDKKSGLVHDHEMAMSRKELEREADRYGVVWTHLTTDAELEALIARRTTGGSSMDQGANAGLEAAPCFGLYWDVPSEEACQSCDGRVPCLEKFAVQTVPDKRAELGANATRDELARVLEVSEEAIDQAVAHLAKKLDSVVEVQAEPVEAAPVPLDDVQSEEDEDRAAGGEYESDEIAAQTEAPEQDSGPPTMEKSHLSLVPKEPVDELETEDMAKKKKKATKKKVVVKKKAASGTKKKTKKAPVKKVKATCPPQKAEAAKPAAASVKKKAKRAKSVTSATAQDAGKKPKKYEQTDPWGKHTWASRHARERKNPLVKQLTNGMLLRREYNGEMHEVRVLKACYKYQDELFPTLYSVVKQITGTQQSPRQLDKYGRRPEGHRQLCNWSAPKFFNLKALFQK